MIKNKKRISSSLFLCAFIANLLNVTILVLGLPIALPFSSFIFVRCCFIALTESKFYYLLICLFVLFILVCSARAMKLNKIIIPIVSLTYILIDTIYVFWVFINTDFWVGYLPSIIWYFVILLFGILTLKDTIKDRLKHEGTA